MEPPFKPEMVRSAGLSADHSSSGPVQCFKKQFVYENPSAVYSNIDTPALLFWRVEIIVECLRLVMLKFVQQSP